MHHTLRYKWPALLHISAECILKKTQQDTLYCRMQGHRTVTKTKQDYGNTQVNNNNKHKRNMYTSSNN